MESERAGRPSRMGPPIGEAQVHNMSPREKQRRIVRLFQNRPIFLHIGVPFARADWSFTPLQALPGEIFLVILGLLAPSEFHRYSAANAFCEYRKAQKMICKTFVLCLGRCSLYVDGASTKESSFMMLMFLSVLSARSQIGGTSPISWNISASRFPSRKHHPAYMKPANIPTIQSDETLHQLRKAVSTTCGCGTTNPSSWVTYTSWSWDLQVTSFHSAPTCQTIIE